jgi:copper(I)-binding protein
MRRLDARRGSAEGIVATHSLIHPASMLTFLHSLRRRAAPAALGLASALCVHGGAWAQSLGALRVSESWTRSTNVGQTVGGGYLSIRNQGTAPDRLVAASSPAAQRVEIHSMALDGNVMRMRPVDGIDLPAGGGVELKPGGLHLMLIGLKEPLKGGASVPVTLRFEKAGAIEVRLSVRATGSAESAHAPAHPTGVDAPLHGTPPAAAPGHGSAPAGTHKH